MSHKKVRPLQRSAPTAMIPEGAVAVFELTTGQSSVELTVDSKGQVKPGVKVYHRDPAEASRIAQDLFDAQILKYVTLPLEIARRAAAAA